MSAEQRLVDLDIVLPLPGAPAGLYSPVVLSGDLLYVSGQIPTRDGAVVRTGRMGDSDITIDEAAELARVCAINALSHVRNYLGTLDRVVQAVRVGGFVASAPDFTDHPKVINGASQLLLDVFGDAGKHARVAVGVAALPAGVPVEVEFVFEVAL